MTQVFLEIVILSPKKRLSSAVVILNTGWLSRCRKYLDCDCLPLIFSAGSGELEFEEFCILAARFLIEEDEEQMRRELKEAFRFYDKDGREPPFWPNPPEGTVTQVKENMNGRVLKMGTVHPGNRR